MGLSTDSDPDVLFAVAMNPRSPKRALMNIARTGTLGEEVAENPNVSSTILDYLSKSKDWKTRAAVAKSQHVSEASLEALSEDPVGLVRRQVRQNRLTPKDTVQRVDDLEEFRAEMHADHERKAW